MVPQTRSKTSNSYTLSLIIVATAISSLHAAKFTPANCTQISSCDCLPNDNKLELQCPSTDVPTTRINYQAGHVLGFDCEDNLPGRDGNRAHWPVFDAGPRVEQLLVHNCTLPRSGEEGVGGLEWLLQRYGIERVDVLVVDSVAVQSLVEGHAILLGTAGSGLLQRLKLQAVHGISPELFQGLSNITVLNMEKNTLGELDADYFAATPELLYLTLSMCELHTLHAGTFSGLQNLLELELWGNDLTSLPPEVFTPLTRLVSLELSSNQLTSLDNGVFDALKNLQRISLFNNHLTVLAEGLFQHNLKVTSIRFEENANLSMIPYLGRLPSLEEFRAHNCRIKTIAPALLSDCANLTKVELHRNALERLPEELFTNSSRLRHLNLSNNSLTALPGQFLTMELPSFEHLDVSYNRIASDLNRDSFARMPALSLVNFAHNRVSKLTFSTFNKNMKLRLVDFSYNDLSLPDSEAAFYNYCVFETNKLLEVLNLRGNRITDFRAGWLAENLNIEMIDLRDNNISHLSYVQLYTISNHAVVVQLENNAIHTIDFTGADALIAEVDADVTGTAQLGDKVVKVQVGNNPWHCDCGMYELLQYYQGQLDFRIRARIQFLENGELKCVQPQLYQGLSILKLQPENVACSLADVGIDAAMGGSEQRINETYCPSECDCSFKPHGKTIIVDCSARNLTGSVPALRQLLPAYFEHLEVWLQQNALSSGPSRTADLIGYDNVTTLKLEYNQITKLDWLPAKIKNLSLDHNNLTVLSNDVLDQLNVNQVKPTLHANPWICDCNAVNLTNFVRDNFINHNDIRCAGRNQQLKQLAEIELCPTHSYAALIAVGVLLPLLLVALGAAVYFRWRQHINVWIYSKPSLRWMVTVADLDKDKLYDAFICYANENESYVEKLVKDLETGEHAYRVCIHRRDWVPGELIATQIEDSIAASRRTIVVISEHFLRSEWARMEFRTAHNSDLREGRSRLIVILHGHMDAKALKDDKELKDYCNTKTYLQDTDPHFWQKLHYVMPHGRHHEVKAKSKLGQIFVNIERQDLCATPSTPNNGTTPPAFGSDTLLHKLDPLEFRPNGKFANHLTHA